MKAADKSVTRKDVEGIVGRIVGDIVSDALQRIAARFDQMDKRFDRLERKLDKICDTVAHHSIDTRALQRKTA